jgi:hypothetical protein
MRYVLALLAIGLAMITVISGVACATTYYVATNGSDSNPGSSSQPWATIQYAVDSTVAGDTILVRAGSYAGARFENSGAAGAPKTLTVETAGTVTLNALSPVARHSGIIEVEKYNAAVHYWVISGFTINGNNHTMRPIDSRSIDGQDNTHITASNNTVFDALKTGISSGHTHYVLIENNVTSSNAEHGTYTNNSSDYGIERGNLVYDNYACGMHHNGDRKTGGGDGIMSFWLNEKNIVYGNGTGGGAAINCDGVQDSKFLNNLAYNNTAGGLTWYYTDSSANCQRDLFYNNTMVFQDGVGRNVVYITKGKSLPINNKVKNNILYTNNAAKSSICTYSSSVAGFESDYNVVVDRFSINDGRAIISLATWSTYGYDAHSLISDPATLFVDAANHNFHLKSTSPAINAGTTLTDVVDDIEGYSTSAVTNTIESRICSRSIV